MLFLWDRWDYSPYFLEADSCEHSGNCWDLINSVCITIETNAEKLCTRGREE